MEDNKIDIVIPKEKFRLVQTGERISDKKFEDKPIGYLKDAWIRFRKNKASVAATVIIIIIVLFALLAPFVCTTHDAQFVDSFYAKKAPRLETMRALGFFDGGENREFSEKGMIKAAAVGVGAVNYDKGGATISEGMKSHHQPLIRLGEGYTAVDATRKKRTMYKGRIDVYLEVGFIYRSIEQSEYNDIIAWEEKTGIKVLYPLIEENEYNIDPLDANNWYKSEKGTPVKTLADGSTRILSYGPDLVLEENYKRNKDGSLAYYEYAGGGDVSTAQYRVRMLYYNYYIYKNGFPPQYLFGTDSQGYDLALRMADGIRLSLVVAISVSLINLVIGAVYGAIEGYYGGATDILLERVSDILAGIPFVIVATLFQIHLSAKVGTIPSLLFAFVLTGWIGTAARVRTQFYRFKNQEYVMAARTLGARDRRIIWKHIFPNSLGTIITSCALVIPGVINSESTLSFLGIVKFSTTKVTSLDTLLSDASSIWTNYPHLMIFPAIVISLLMICFNLFGNGLRDAFNPSLRGVED